MGHVSVVTKEQSDQQIAADIVAAIAGERE
jgi:hypothetical protein